MTEYLYKPYTNKQYADFVVKNKGRKLMIDDEKVWFEDYPDVEPTIEEQNEAIRQTREQLYIQTSDKLKADYDEAVARGADNAEELKTAWLESKDKIRAENPYIVESEQVTEQVTETVEERKEVIDDGLQRKEKEIKENKEKDIENVEEKSTIL